MRYLPLLLVSLGLAAASRSSSSSSSSSEEDDDGGCAQADRIGLAATRVDTMAFRLERLANKIEKMQSRTESLSKYDESNHATAVAAQLERIEGGGCEEGEFRCGVDSECISSLLSCDGIPDCDNGHDEDEEVCKSLVDSGDHFKGHVRWEACKANPEAELTITISQNRIISYFQPRLWLSANVNLEYSEGGNVVGHANSHEGFYNYGLRRLVLQPSDGDHIGAICDFFTNDLADCRITEVGTLKDCAHVRIHRV